MKLSKLTKGLLPLFFLFLLAFSVMGSSDWEQYQKWDGNMGYQDTTFTGNFDTTDIYSEYAAGSNFQPIVIDWDQDGVVDIIAPDGNFIRVFNLSSSGVITLQSSFNMGVAQTSIGLAEDFNDDGNITYIADFGNITYSLTYNGSNIHKTINYTNSREVVTGIACDVISGGYVCYWGLDNGNMTEFNPQTGVATEYQINKTIDVFTLSGSTRMAPTLTDIDVDGNHEIVSFCDWDDDDKYGICVINRNTMTLNTAFSSDGIIDDITSADGAGGLLVLDLDGDVTQEICIGIVENGGAADQEAALNCYNTDGTSFDSTIIIEDSGDAGIPLAAKVFAADTDNAGRREICAIATSDEAAAGRVKLAIKCYDGSTGSFVATTNYTNTSTNAHTDWYDEGVVTVTDMNSDGYEDIIAGETIFFSNGTTFAITQISESIDERTNPVPVDMNDDGKLEICGLYTNEVWCASSNFTNVPPNLTDSFGMLWDSPICNGTKQRYSAKEYDEDAAQPAGTNYFNDIDTDTERIVADCWGNTTLTNGTYSLATPTVDCWYNKTGSYIVTLYLQDDDNPTDYTQLDTFGINVITGAPGSTCNSDDLGIGEEPIIPTVTVPIPTATSKGITSALDTITGGDTTMKLIIGLIFMLVILVGVANVAQNILVAVMVTMVSFIIFVAIGLFPVWMLIIFFLIIVFLGLAGLGTGLVGNGGD